MSQLRIRCAPACFTRQRIELVVTVVCSDKLLHEISFEAVYPCSYGIVEELLRAGEMHCCQRGRYIAL